MAQTTVKKELKVTLADILVGQGVVTDDQIKQCEVAQQESGSSIEQIILDNEFAARKAIANALGSYYDVPYIDLDNYDIDTNVLELVPERLARKYKFLPLFKIENNLTVAILNPRNLFGIDEIRDMLDCDIEVTVSSEDQILQALDRYYGSTGKTNDLTEIVDEIVLSEFGDLDEDVEVEQVKEVDLETVSEQDLEQAPVVKLLNTIIHRAIREGVSDIHIQHEEDAMIVRYRLDGTLYQAATLPKNLRSTLVSRIKVLSGMNIAECRAPQDGKF